MKNKFTFQYQLALRGILSISSQYMDDEFYKDRILNSTSYQFGTILYQKPNGIAYSSTYYRKYLIKISVNTIGEKFDFEFKTLDTQFDTLEKNTINEIRTNILLFPTKTNIYFDKLISIFDLENKNELLIKMINEGESDFMLNLINETGRRNSFLMKEDFDSGKKEWLKKVHDRRATQYQTLLNFAHKIEDSKKRILEFIHSLKEDNTSKNATPRISNPTKVVDNSNLELYAVLLKGRHVYDTQEHIRNFLAQKYFEIFTKPPKMGDKGLVEISVIGNYEILVDVNAHFIDEAENNLIHEISKNVLSFNKDQKQDYLKYIELMALSEPNYLEIGYLCEEVDLKYWIRYHAGEYLGNPALSIDKDEDAEKLLNYNYEVNLSKFNYAAQCINESKIRIKEFIDSYKSDFAPTPNKLKKIKWNSGPKDLVELFTELQLKGWIEPINLHGKRSENFRAIYQLFDILEQDSNSRDKEGSLIQASQRMNNIINKSTGQTIKYSGELGHQAFGKNHTPLFDKISPFVAKQEKNTEK